MSILKKRIEAILGREETGDDVPPYRVLPEGHPMWVKIKSESILSLVRSSFNKEEPSGVIAFKPCQYCNDTQWQGGSCPCCSDKNGVRTGRIERELTNFELLEWARPAVKHFMVIDNQVGYLPSGERLEVKK